MSRDRSETGKDVTDAWIRGFAAGLSELYQRLLSGSDGPGVVAAAKDAKLTLAAFKQAGVSPFDLDALRRAGVR